MAEVAAMQRYIPCGLYFPGGSVYPGDSNLAWYKHFCCKHKQHLIQILEKERMEIMALCFIVPAQTMAASGLSLSCVVAKLCCMNNTVHALYPLGEKLQGTT